MRSNKLFNIAKMTSKKVWIRVWPPPPPFRQKTYFRFLFFYGRPSLFLSRCVHIPDLNTILGMINIWIFNVYLEQNLWIEMLWTDHAPFPPLPEWFFSQLFITELPSSKIGGYVFLSNINFAKSRPWSLICYLACQKFVLIQNPHKSELCRYHNIDLVPELDAAKTSGQEVLNHTRNWRRLR